MLALYAWREHCQSHAFVCVKVRINQVDACFQLFELVTLSTVLLAKVVTCKVDHAVAVRIVQISEILSYCTNSIHTQGVLIF